MTEALTGADLDRAIIEASRELIAALVARPRNQTRVDTARAAYDALIGQLDG